MTDHPERNSVRGRSAPFNKGAPAPAGALNPAQWAISPAPVPYAKAVAFMEQRAAEIRAGSARELVWLLEHPPLYTAGTSANPADLLTPDRFPVHDAGRGGQYTYHGPGQRVVYVMLDVGARGRDVRAFVGALEDWLIATLAQFNIKGERREDRVGVWVVRRDLNAPREDKIAALGIRLRRWVSFHGLSINVDPDLDHFSGIVPCGITAHGVTSFTDLGQLATMQDIDIALKTAFIQRFGPVEHMDACKVPHLPGA